MDSGGKRYIQNLTQKWIWNAVLINLLISVSLTAITLVVLYKFGAVQFWWSLPFFGLVVLIVFIVSGDWKMKEKDVTRYINRTFPQVEESADLLLIPVSQLSLLQRLQQQKIKEAIAGRQIIHPLKRKHKAAIIFFLIAVLICALMLIVPFSSEKKGIPVLKNSSSINSQPEKKLAEVQSLQLTITPPAYTGKQRRQQSRFNVEAEENAVVKWTIQTTSPPAFVRLKINDKTVVPLSAVNAQKTTWTTQMAVKKPGFYQLQINDHLSELYSIEVIHDKAPVVEVQSPKSGATILSGQPKVVNIAATITDDYGLNEAVVFATVASGNGEAVKFKEQQFPLSNFVKGSRQSMARQRIDLKSLGMQPGDELYFYLRATDNHNQQTRSDIIIVRLEDTAQLLSMDGLVNGLDLKPEFFRSQRQIIIETEQLLRDKDTIATTAFNNKSNDLGIDQQLLRLRYGKFLGEETNTEIGEEHDHEGEHKTEPKAGTGFGNAAEILEQFSHKHDIAEDATFFDPETKKQLKATLAEMWKAELKLRLYKPAEALPFEYNALRLLKDLQQKSRVYVDKTSSKMPPLKPAEKRLTGELDKIGQPVLQSEYKPAGQDALSLRQALGLLEALKQSPANRPLLQSLLPAGQQLIGYAAADPGRYLAALEAYRRLVNNQSKKSDINTVQKALQQILQAPAALPSQKSAAPSSKLSGQYFNNLKRSSP